MRRARPVGIVVPRVAWIVVTTFPEKFYQTYRLDPVGIELRVAIENGPFSSLIDLEDDEFPIAMLVSCCVSESLGDLGLLRFEFGRSAEGHIPFSAVRNTLKDISAIIQHI